MVNVAQQIQKSTTPRSSYLLDTNVVSEMMRPVPDQRVVSALHLAALDGIGIHADCVALPSRRQCESCINATS